MRLWCEPGGTITPYGLVTFGCGSVLRGEQRPVPGVDGDRPPRAIDATAVPVEGGGVRFP